MAAKRKKSFMTASPLKGGQVDIDKLRADIIAELKPELELELRESIREEFILEFDLGGPKAKANIKRQWLYRKGCKKGQIFEGEKEIEKALKDGWKDHPKDAK